MSNVEPRVEIKGGNSDFSIRSSAPYISIVSAVDPWLVVPAGGSYEIDTGAKIWFYIKSERISNKDQMGHMSLCHFESKIPGLVIDAPLIRANNSDDLVFNVRDITGAGVTINPGDEICRFALVTFFKVAKLH